MQKLEANKKKRKTEALIGKVFFLCIIIFILLNILIPDKEISESENRMLATCPRLTWNGLISGDFMEQFENYLADQFAGRNLWRQIQVSISRFGGNKEIQGVILGKKGQLMEEIVLPQEELLTKNLQAIQKFSADYEEVPVYMMMVPDAASVLTESLPSLVKPADQVSMITRVKNELGESVVWLDALSALNNHKGEKIYYKTDHHWTSLGAFYVFQETAPQMKISGDIPGGYAAYPVSVSFNGVLASKSGCSLNEKEEIDIYVPKSGDNDVVVNYVDEQRKTASLYDSSKLDTKDQFGVFLGGNSSVIDIKTLSESTRRLLVVKDSFANNFIPFLTPYFREIVVMDPRYYSGTAEDLMEDYRITDALFLYSGNTFFQDNHISGVLGSE